MVGDHIHTETIRPSKAMQVSCLLVFIAGVLLLIMTLYRAAINNVPQLIATYFLPLAVVSLLFIVFPLWIISMKVQLNSITISYSSIFTHKEIRYNQIARIRIWNGYLFREGHNLNVSIIGENGQSVLILTGPYLPPTSLAFIVHTLSNRN